MKLDEEQSEYDADIAERFLILNEVPVPEDWGQFDRIGSDRWRSQVVAAVATAAVLVGAVIGVTWMVAVNAGDDARAVTATTAPSPNSDADSIVWSDLEITQWLASATGFKRATDIGRDFGEEVLGWSFVRVGKRQVFGRAGLPEGLVGLTVFGPGHSTLDMLVIETDEHGWTVVGLGDLLALRTTEDGRRELFGPQVSRYAANVTYEVAVADSSGVSVVVTDNFREFEAVTDGEIRHVLRVQHNGTGAVTKVDSYGLYVLGESHELVDLPAITSESPPNRALSILEGAGLHGAVVDSEPIIGALAWGVDRSAPAGYKIAGPRLLESAHTERFGETTRIEVPAGTIVGLKLALAPPVLRSMALDGATDSLQPDPSVVIPWLDTAGPFATADDLIDSFAQEVLDWEEAVIDEVPVVTSLTHPGELRHVELRRPDRAVHLLIAGRSSGWRVLDLGGDGAVNGRESWVDGDSVARGELTFFPHRGQVVSHEVTKDQYDRVDRVVRIVRDGDASILQLDAYGVGMVGDQTPFADLVGVPGLLQMTALDAFRALESVGLHGLVTNPPPGFQVGDDTSWLADYNVVGTGTTPYGFVPEGSFVDIAIQRSSP